MLTPLEKEALEVFLEVRDQFAPGRVMMRDYVFTMGKIARMIRSLENKKYGCPTGIHASAICQCRPPLAK